MKKLVSMILALVLCLVACTSLAATADQFGLWDDKSGVPEVYTGREKPLTLTFGQLGSGRENDYMMHYYNRFNEVVTELTGGSIVFDFYPNGQLGGEPDMLDQVISGTLDISCISSNVIGTILPGYYAYNLPFAFDNYANYWEVCAYESDLMDTFRAYAQDSELFHFVGTYLSCARGCQNTKRAIRTAEDFKGLTFRIMAGQIYTDIFQALGSSVSTLAFAELYTGLQQGVVDGEEITISMAYDNALYEVEGYASELGITYNSNLFIMSNDCWNKLTEEERIIISYASAEAEKAGYAAMTEWDAKYYKLCEEKGVNVVYNKDLTAEERQSFIDATADVWAKYADVIGKDVYEPFAAAVEAARANGLEGVMWWE